MLDSISDITLKLIENRTFVLKTSIFFLFLRNIKLSMSNCYAMKSVNH